MVTRSSFYFGAGEGGQRGGVLAQKIKGKMVCERRKEG